jgi:ATP-dependent Clp protease ATP-binding subunit ClpX
MAKPPAQFCSFCLRPRTEVGLLISGHKAEICSDCVEQAHEIVHAERTSAPGKRASNELKLIKPKQIRAFLDEYVIGQDEAKITLAVAVYNHYKRINQAGKNKDDMLF